MRESHGSLLNVELRRLFHLVSNPNGISGVYGTWAELVEFDEGHTDLVRLSENIWDIYSR